MRACAILAVLLAGAALAADEKDKDKDKDKLVVKEIPSKDLKLTHPKAGKPREPATVASAEELEKNEVVGKAADEVKKHIDFAKQKLVVFAWSGSDRDILTYSIGVGSDARPFVYVEYLPGKTTDAKQHARLLVVPKDLKVVIDGK